MKNDQFDFPSLRKKVLAEIDIKLNNRINNNPVPNQDEIYIGAFREELEPQVQDALFKMYQKGYSAESSGFYGIEGEFQAIDGYFEIDDKIREQLYKLGVLVLKGYHLGMPGYSKYWTQIRFYPQKANINLIKKKWNKIISILPDLGHFAPPSTSGGAQQFRQKYCPENIKVEALSIQHLLKVAKIHPDYKKKYQKRLKEITAKK